MRIRPVLELALPHEDVSAARHEAPKGAVTRRWWRALTAIEENGFPIEHDDVDVLVNGVRFSDLGEEKGHMMSICYERHLALEWVLRGDDWDEARADT
jgi:hypothetical protein